jgi:hypothetical protein
MGANASNGSCPQSQPAQGSSCTLPKDQTCNYEVSCPLTTYRCSCDGASGWSCLGSGTGSCDASASNDSGSAIDSPYDAVLPGDAMSQRGQQQPQLRRVWQRLPEFHLRRRPMYVCGVSLSAPPSTPS